jgi:uncharacterized membrane protein
MKSPRERKWLYAELPRLVEEGLLSTEQARKLRERDEERGGAQTGFLAVGLLGVLLLGGGVILLVAYNWDSLSRFWRAALSFAPLLLGQLAYAHAFFRRAGSPAWREGASTFLVLMIGATLALISQTYHIASEASDFLLSWLLLSLPLLYLSRPLVPGIAYLVGIAAWAAYARGGLSAGYWALLAAAIPYLYGHFRERENSTRGLLLAWAAVLSLIFAWFFVVELNLTLYAFLGTALVFSLLYHLGAGPFAESGAPPRRPFQTSAVLGGLIFLLTLSFELRPDPIDWEVLWRGSRYPAWAARINFGLLIAALAAYLYLLFRTFRRRQAPAKALLLLPLAVIAYLALQQAERHAPAAVLANLCALGLGLVYLISGLRRRSLGLINIGMAFILLLALLRFIATDWNYVGKGLAFIALGASFLLGNWMAARRLRAEAP